MSENISKYEIIKNKIEEQISQGFYKENDKIPSENELCRAFASSRITVRKALDELVTTGVLYRQQGIGTFVKPKTVEVSADVDKVLLILPNYPELFAAGIVSDMLSGIQKSLRETQYTLVTLMEPRNEADIEKFLQSIKTIRPNGIIYSFYYGDSMIVDELKKFEVPIVFLDAEPKDNEFDIVTGEDFESAYRVTQLAIMSGMKNVGFYSSWNQDFSTCSARKNGIKKALEDSRIPIREGQLLLRNTESEFHESVTKYDIVTDIKEYLQKNDYLDVLIVMNDTVAFAAYKAASELRKDIPADQLRKLQLEQFSDNWSYHIRTAFFQIWKRSCEIIIEAYEWNFFHDTAKKNYQVRPAAQEIILVQRWHNRSYAIFKKLTCHIK